jgi:hypothetical protein
MRIPAWAMSFGSPRAGDAWSAHENANDRINPLVLKKRFALTMLPFRSSFPREPLYPYTEKKCCQENAQ